MTNAELARSYMDAFASGDPDAIARHVSEDFENIQVGVLGSGCTGKDTYRERLGGFLSDFTNLHYTVDELIVDGDNVAATYTMTFTQNDRPVEIDGVMIMTIRDDRIAVRRDYWDGLSYQQQAGAK